MIRHPDVSASHIVFVYAGDIWLAPKTGGEAIRLSSPRGEETFPKFSPDGSQIAFSGNYDGNQDLYVMPTSGGLPLRLTHHGAPDRMVDWSPDGHSLLYATTMTSYKDRFNQLYRISVRGGLPEKLPVPYGEFGAISPDGRTLAYQPISVDFRTWKRYRGGMNPDLWLFDLTTYKARNLTQSDASESIPMWHGQTLYFLSDRGPEKRFNLWAYDFARDRFRQITFFKDYDVRFPSIGPEEIVFEHAGRLYLMSLTTEEVREVSITVRTDRATLRPRVQNVSNLIQNAAPSPTGKRAVFEARGEIFTVPAEHGVVLNVSRTPGAAERYPSWSPDGQWIACFSDRSGEYELTLLPANPSSPDSPSARTLTRLGPGFRYQPQWSPDSKKILWLDQTMRIWVYDLEIQTNRCIDQQKWMYHGDLSRFRVSWSPDSRWIAYAADLENRQTAIVLYDYVNHRRHQVTSGFYNDDLPVFDPDGKYLFFRTFRDFNPIYSELDNSWIYANGARLAAVPLRKTVPSPTAPRNDDESPKSTPDQKPEKTEDSIPTAVPARTANGTQEHAMIGAPHPDPPVTDEATNSAASQDSRASNERSNTEKPDKKSPPPVEIDLDKFERRVVLLPTKPGRYDDLAAVPGKLLYRWLPRAGSDVTASPIEFYDLEKRETKRVLDDADDLQLTADRSKLLVRKGNRYAFIEPKEGQRMEKVLVTDRLEATIDPPAEWKQIFTDAWRFQRDYFYDPGLHGVNWHELRDRYERLLQEAVTRWDVNYIIGELIAELNASHTYRSGGDVEQSPERGVGYLGCDFALTNGAYQIIRILESAPWEAEVRSPLREPGITNVQEGHYLLAVNGEPIDTSKDPWAAFQGLAQQPVLLTINDKPNFDGAWQVLVQTLDLAAESRLRNLAWIEHNRRRVEELSQGRIGYVYVPDTGRHGQNELMRQWRGQITKEGLIIDERFNSGGQIPDRFIEVLNRPLRNYWGVRDGLDWAWPPVAHFGPKAMLINGWSGSGGDCFPYYFKQSGLGPLIGQRTWGGLIGITGTPTLIDGGSVTVPTFGIYSATGEWIIEGYGVDPDIEVVDDPGEMARGRDPQLERAVYEVLKALKQTPPPRARKPPYPNRAS
ncbi:MAG: PDZ domain-containing protein [Verrucomicrobiota bacterium]|nr:PDZ domain-containing protein [Limisphaera sp.]MDW8382219.1 PDZ domain-containing protein [Verrucomicrobiota bacterium]